MKKRINKFFLTITACVAFFPCAVMAQGSAPPLWLDGDVRNLQYSQDKYYTGFAETAVASGEEQEKALNRAKQLALGELSDRVRVMVNSRKTSTDTSTGGSDIEEQIRSTFSSIIQTESQTELAGSKLETYYDSKTRTVYAFAFVSKTELSAYYRKQISLWLNRVEGALQTADGFKSKGYKIKARKECESIIESFAKIACAQNLLTAIDEQTDENVLQQNRSESLRNTLEQTVIDLENSIYIYMEYNETVNGEPTQHIADRLPGMLAEHGCGCNFIEIEEEADYIVKIDASLKRCSDAPENFVFCYAAATASVYNAHTQKTLKPKIAESKGGWSNNDRSRATEEAFKELANKIVENIIPAIKN
ncbi:MAG: LPP20 family lipoprotein [Prevotellaceae bacterium]|jgi:hypothetical protein|nr:LPP20 family lipoprotein [Prevotellaceae bacterium]